jgi:hypothetical protein
MLVGYFSLTPQAVGSSIPVLEATKSDAFVCRLLDPDGCDGGSDAPAVITNRHMDKIRLVRIALGIISLGQNFISASGKMCVEV